MTKKFVNNSTLGISNRHSMKDKFRDKARYFALDFLSTVRRGDSENFLRCLYCHYVFDDQLDAFEQIIKSLSRVGKFVDTKTCEQMISGEIPIKGKVFHLSFDDGFKNNFTNAYPILKRLSIPAIFFVPTAIIDAEYDVVRDYCLNTTNYSGVFEMMTWANLAELVDNGYEVGSHTQTHARLSEISVNADRLIQELQGSKEDIETKLKISCDYISWPYGKLLDADNIALCAIRNSGYSACFGGYRGPISADNTDLMSIPRHHFEAHWPLRHILYFARGNGE